MVPTASRECQVWFLRLNFGISRSKDFAKSQRDKTIASSRKSGCFTGIFSNWVLRLASFYSWGRVECRLWAFNSASNFQFTFIARRFWCFGCTWRSCKCCFNAAWCTWLFCYRILSSLFFIAPGIANINAWVRAGGRYVGWERGSVLASRLGISTATFTNPSLECPGALFRTMIRCVRYYFILNSCLVTQALRSLKELVPKCSCSSTLWCFLWTSTLSMS